jgi:SAM-dependent methyltransferase
MPADRWQDAEAYERFIGRWSRRAADQFLAWLSVPAGATWVDVGCGTGALAGQIVARTDPARVTGVDPSAAFVEAARDRVTDPVAAFEVGQADRLPLDSGSADVVVSGLVLNFVPDAPAALDEAARVARPGGTVAAYVWDYAGRMELLRRFWDAAVELDPSAAELDEGRRFPIAAPAPLATAWVDAGLAEVLIAPLDVPTRFADFDDLWLPFTVPIGPAPGYVATLPPDRREALRERLRSTLPTGPEGTIDLIARAWAIRGRTPAAAA